MRAYGGITTAEDFANYHIVLREPVRGSLSSPGTSILLNNQMDDFSTQPNTFGLVGAEANAIAPGKRPLSSMSPTIVLRGGKPVLAVGTAGGPTIITQTVGVLDLGLALDATLAQPRWHHQWRPDEIRLDRAPATVREHLKKLGTPSMP